MNQLPNRFFCSTLDLTKPGHVFEYLFFQDLQILERVRENRVQLEVRGAEGQLLRLQLTDVGGRLISQRQIESAKPVEQQMLSLQGQPAGLLFLPVSSESAFFIYKISFIFYRFVGTC